MNDESTRPARPSCKALLVRFHHPLFIIALTALLAGCGFHLRGATTLPFDTLYVEAPQGSLFATQLRRVIGAGSSTKVVNTPAGADATLRLLTEAREKEILSLSAGGRVRELQLRYRIQYQVSGKDKTIIAPPAEIVLRRDFSFNDQDQLSKEAEEALLYRDMQTDAVQQLVRRLQATKIPQKS
ncbi:MAG: LPS assembly lipoprotein LptE [Pseudomonadota bacterium]